MDKLIIPFNTCLENIKNNKNWEKHYTCCIFKHQSHITKNLLYIKFKNSNKEDIDFYKKCLNKNTILNKSLLNSY